MTDDFSGDGEFAELEARLAAYGDVLRSELEETKSGTGRGALPPTLRPVQLLGAGTASADREPRLRRGILVAAVLALIAGLSFMAVRPSAPTTKLEVASAPTATGAIGSAPPSDSVDEPEADEVADLSMEITADTSEDDVTLESSVDVSSTGRIKPSVPAAEGDESPDDNSEPAEEPLADEPAEQDGEPAEQDATATPVPEPTEVSQVAPTCVRGELVDERCRVVVGEPTTTGFECGDADGVFEDERGCYRVRKLVFTCGAGAEIHDAFFCRRLTDSVPPTCPDGYLFERARELCVRTIQSSSLTCPEGTLVGDECEIVGPAPTSKYSSCPEGTVDIPDDGRCYVWPDCGPLVPSPGGECRAMGEVDETFTCPTMSGMYQGQCIGYGYWGERSCPDESVPEGGFCANGDRADVICDAGDIESTLVADLDGSLSGTCLTLDGPPISVLTCRTTSALDEPEIGNSDGETVNSLDQCYIEYQRRCSYVTCVDEEPGPLTCGPAYRLRESDGNCVRTTYAERKGCEAGVELEGGRCELTSEPEYGPWGCPDRDDVIEYEQNCYELYKTQDCEPKVQDGCRVPVEPAQFTLSCDEGLVLDDPDCVRWEDPIAS